MEEKPADIPDLKKKDEERKKAGAIWSGARAAAGKFAGAMGGNVAGAAAGNSAALGGVLTSTFLGKLAVGGAAFLVMGTAGVVGYKVLNGGGGAARGGGVASGAASDLGAIADSMRVRSGGDDRFAVAAKGEISFDSPSAEKKSQTPPPADAQAVEATPTAIEPVMADAGAPQAPSGQLAHDLKGAQLSGGFGGGFGEKNIFAGKDSMSKFGSGAKLGSDAGKLAKTGAAKGRLSPMRSHAPHALASARKVMQGSMRKALAQAQFARGLSSIGAKIADQEEAKGTSDGAFEGQQMIGGRLLTKGAPDGDTPTPLGAGASGGANAGAKSDDPGASLDLGALSLDPPPPDITPEDNGKPDQGLQDTLRQISDMAEAGRKKIEQGWQMLAIAGLVAAAGVIMLFFPQTFFMGVGLSVGGALFVAAALWTMYQGQQETQQAVDAAHQLGNRIGDQSQAKVISWCVEDAIAHHTRVEACQAPDSVTQASKHVEKAVEDIQKVKKMPVDKVKMKAVASPPTPTSAPMPK